MALLPVSHKPITARARQFDGSLEAFQDMLSARPGGLTATLTFDTEGVFVGLELSGGQLGSVVGLRVGDWAVFPDDATQPAFSLDGEHAGDYWQAT